MMQLGLMRQKQEIFYFYSCYVVLTCQVIDMNENHLGKANTKRTMRSEIEFRFRLTFIHKFSFKMPNIEIGSARNRHVFVPIVKMW